MISNARQWLSVSSRCGSHRLRSTPRRGKVRSGARETFWTFTGTSSAFACPVSFNRILSCIIGHANPTTGRCDPKQKLIATETGYSRDTVVRAVKWAEAEGFLKSEARGLGRSKAYHPQWALCEMFWVAIAEDIETQKAASRGRDGISPCSNNGQHACSNKGQHDVLQHAATHESQNGTSKNEYHPERVPSDEVTLVGCKKQNEKGNQGEPVESLSTNSQPRAEHNVYALINLNAEKLETAAAAVDTDLSRHPLYSAYWGGRSWKPICRKPRRPNSGRRVPAQNSSWLALPEGGLQAHERQRHQLSRLPFCRWLLFAPLQEVPHPTRPSR
jgi:hypothetical protein